MSGRLKKILLLALAVVLLAGVSRVQVSLNHDRDRLGITRMEPLENAPPMLAFTTVALGGFRGLISNLLWIRAGELQDEDKYFEMVQLADWIHELEPHFAQVWAHQAWNMAYNISVRFKDFPDRWRWVQRGIELLRDEGLRYNPNEPLLYEELGWFFQHKIGHNIDDAHRYYKRAWFDEMSRVFKGARPDFEELIHPQTEDAKARAGLLREKYKMDPKFMKGVDGRYGPLEWRLPEAHAIYWAAMGLKKADENPARVNREDLLALRRVIFQSLQQSVLHGRVVVAPPSSSQPLDLGPNFDIIRKTSDAFEQAKRDEPDRRDYIGRGHRNLLRDVVYYLYTSNRKTEAAEWFAYLQKEYPKDPLIGGRPDALPGSMTLDDYAYARVEEQVQDISQDRTKIILEGLIQTSFISLAQGEDDVFQGYEDFAQRVWKRYQSKTASSGQRVELPPLNEIKQDVLRRLLDPERGLVPEMAAQLRTRLNLPAPTNAAPVSPAP